MKNILKLIIILISLCIVAFFLFINDYYHADAKALNALASDDTVTVQETDYGWFFDGPSNDTVFVFYPGAKVEAEAYAPLLHTLAGVGIDVCLPRMPLRIAFFGINKADAILNGYEYKHCYLGGHSLGGACATFYAAKHGEKLDGMIYLASYPTEKLDEHIGAIFIYGTEDNVLNMDIYQKNLEYIPEHTECIITGGNHAQFGSYGTQKGDGVATITPEEQITQTVEAIRDYVNGLR